ncbi:MAG: DMT family transporter [Clostridiales Family XIII bacterium]|jgi:drug/metabolite transporter (DMT)-like permease|nr:DMT family transporter [Clostridiales Family XIII bacterium]
MTDKTKDARNKNIGFLLVLLTSVLYGVMPALTQRAYASGVTVESVLTGRYLIGTTLIWMFILLTKKPLRVGGKNFSLLMAVGVNVFFCVFCMTSSYRYLPGAITSLITFLYIVIVNVAEILIGRERARAFRVVCLLLTIGGLILVVYTPTGENALNKTGIVLAMAAGIFYAIWAMSMGAKRFAPFSAEVTMGYMLIVPTVANAVNCVLSGSPILPVTGEQWLYVVLLGLSPGFIAPIAFCAAVKRIGASTASMINTSEPVFAYFAGILLMGDRLSFNATLGGVLIVVGLLLLNVMERRKGSLD